jgi:acyl-CoA-binding protein
MTKTSESYTLIKENFDDVVKIISKGKMRDDIPNSVKLQFYALYKQATIGKCNAPKPWAFNYIESEKWNAWNTLGNMSNEDAMAKYCELYLQHL